MESWTVLNSELKPGQLGELFEFYNNSKTDLIFPQEVVSMFSKDKPYFTQQLRLLKRQRCGKYIKHGKSVKYKAMCYKFEEVLKSEVSKYKCKVEERIQNYQKESIYPFLRKLRNGPM